MAILLGKVVSEDDTQESTFHIGCTEEHCVMCGEVVPEGWDVCPNCMKKIQNEEL